MKKQKINYKAVLLIALVCYSCALSSKNNLIKSVTIKYVEISSLTDFKVPCEDFERLFTFKTITLQDSDSITEFNNKKMLLKNDPSSHYYPDTRIKIDIEYSDLSHEIICISGLAISNDKGPVIYDEKFINYIMGLIFNRNPASR